MFLFSRLWFALHKQFKLVGDDSHEIALLRDFEMRGCTLWLVPSAQLSWELLRSLFSAVESLLHILMFWESNRWHEDFASRFSSALASCVGHPFLLFVAALRRGSVSVFFAPLTDLYHISNSTVCCGAQPVLYLLAAARFRFQFPLFMDCSFSPVFLF